MDKKIERPILPIMICGLDLSGKTSLVKRLLHTEKTKPSLNEQSQSVNIEFVRSEDFLFQIFDLPGNEQFREQWLPYASLSEGIAFVIDSTDKKRLIKASQWLSLIIDEIKEKPILFIANKQDCQDAMTINELLSSFKLLQDVIQQKRSFRIFLTSATTGKGVLEAWTWLLKKVCQKVKIVITISAIILYSSQGEKLMTHSFREELIFENPMLRDFLKTIDNFSEKIFEEEQGMDIIETEKYTFLQVKKNQIICFLVIGKTDNIEIGRNIIDKTLNFIENQTFYNSEDLKRKILDFLLTSFPAALPPASFLGAPVPIDRF